MSLALSLYLVILAQVVCIVLDIFNRLTPKR